MFAGYPGSCIQVFSAERVTHLRWDGQRIRTEAAAVSDESTACAVPLLDDPDEPAASILRQVTRPGDTAPNLYRALANSPASLNAWVGIAWPLREPASVSKADRELAISYLATRRRCRYVEAHHRRFALRRGISEDQLKALGPRSFDSEMFAPAQVALLTMVDEIISEGAASPATVQSASEHFGVAGVVELLVTVGFYEAVCVVNKSLRVPLEDGAEAKAPGMTGLENG
jgi:alkylhydroperoxidase family enzyme